MQGRRPPRRDITTLTFAITIAAAPDNQIIACSRREKDLVKCIICTALPQFMTGHQLVVLQVLERGEVILKKKASNGARQLYTRPTATDLLARDGKGRGHTRSLQMPLCEIARPERPTRRGKWDESYVSSPN